MSKAVIVRVKKKGGLSLKDKQECDVGEGVITERG